MISFPGRPAVLYFYFREHVKKNEIKLQKKGRHFMKNVRNLWDDLRLICILFVFSYLKNLVKISTLVYD